jgi:hypothetical protein
MGETITAIDEVTGYTRPDDAYGSYSGFKVTTDQQAVLLLIDDQQDCCEDWGYFLTEQDTAKFVGAELRGVKLTDTNRGTRQVVRGWSSMEAPTDAIELDEGDVMFIDLETDRGPLQFVAYNAHNGYYGHAALVISEQFKHEVTL